MFKLILKDFKLLRQGIWFVGGAWIFFLVSNNGTGVSFLVISMIIAGIPMGLDEKNNTESLWMSLPVKRSNIVIARYIYILLVGILVVIVTYFAGRLLHVFLPMVFKKIIPFNNLLAAQLPVMFFMSLSCPLYFGFGANMETGIRVIALSLSAILGSIIVLYVLAISLGFDLFNIKPVYNFLGVGILMLISFGISLFIYRQREF